MYVLVRRTALRVPDLADDIISWSGSAGLCVFLCVCVCVCGNVCGIFSVLHHVVSVNKERARESSNLDIS